MFPAWMEIYIQHGMSNVKVGGQEGISVRKNNKKMVTDK